MPAIAAYMRQLREAQHISRDRLGDVVGTAGNNIWRIESEGQVPGGPLLVLMVLALNGSFEDIRDLAGDSVPEDEGRRLALRRLSAVEQAKVNQLRADIGEEKAAAFVQRFNSDPEFRQALYTLVDTAARQS